jgi:hypothetical protein
VRSPFKLAKRAVTSTELEPGPAPLNNEAQITTAMLKNYVFFENACQSDWTNGD